MPSGVRNTDETRSSRVSLLEPTEPIPFGRYLLIGVLGRGGMGEVNLALMEGPGGFRKLVVIKRMHRHLASEPEFLDMFLDEGRLAARLQHPHCVQTFEVGTVGGEPFMTMEFLNGIGLNRIFAAQRRGRLELPVPLLARIVADALDGLAYAHELQDYDGSPLGVVHRDVAPHNLIVTHGGVVKVIDFGIAKAATRAAQTRTGVVKGRYAYMAPEQARGQGVDERSDLWSMGIVLWEGLTTRRLFRGESEIDTLRRLLDQPIEPPSKYADVPPDLEAIVLRALQRSPEDRFGSAAEMRDALETWLSEHAPAVGHRALRRFMQEHFSADRKAIRAFVARCIASSGIQVGSDAAANLSLPSGEYSLGVEGMPSQTPSVTGPHASGGTSDSRPMAAPLASADVAESEPEEGGRKRGGLLWIGAVAALGVLLAGWWVLSGRRAPGPAGRTDSVAAGVSTSGRLGSAPSRAEGADGAEASSGRAVPAEGAGHAPQRAATRSGRPSEGRAAAAAKASERGGRASGKEASEEGVPVHSAVSPESPSMRSVGKASSRSMARRARRPRAKRPRKTRVPGRPKGAEAARGTVVERPSVEQARSPVAGDEQPAASSRPGAPPAGGRSTAAPGRLFLATTPWTKVYMDGRLLGVTPLVGVEVPAGSHAFRFVNGDRGIDERVRLTVPAGGVLRKRLGFR